MQAFLCLRLCLVLESSVRVFPGAIGMLGYDSALRLALAATTTTNDQEPLKF